MARSRADRRRRRFPCLIRRVDYPGMDLYMDEILPGLWLGCQDAADDHESLRRHNITHIVSVREPEMKFTLLQRELPNFVYHRIWALDAANQELSHEFPSAIQFINDAWEAKQGVLIHCRAGISRSATIVCAYLIWRNPELELRDVVESIDKKRRIQPNVGFRFQLRRFIHQQRIRKFYPATTTTTTSTKK